MYPASLETTFLNPYPSDQRVGHAQLHRDINAVIIALQSKLGIDGSLDNTTIDHLVKGALNPGHTHTKDIVGLGSVANALQLIAANNLSDLTNVSVALGNLGISFIAPGFASQAEAESGVDNTKIMSPLRVKQSIAVNVPTFASDAEAIAGVITTKFINPKQAKDNYEIIIQAGSTYTAANSSAQVTVPQSQISYTKNKEITVNKDGTYRTEFTLSSNSTFFGKIYKNGSAIGTERVVGNTTATFTEDFTFVAGDKVQLYTRTDNTNHSFEIINLKLTYDYGALSRYVATVNI